MGFIKQMKDMKSMVHDAPDQIAMAQEMGANAKAMAATQQAQAATQMAALTNASVPGAAGPDLEPIANVSLELYAQISKSLTVVSPATTGRRRSPAGMPGCRPTRPLARPSAPSTRPADMGFMKDLNQLHKTTKEIDKNWDPSAQRKEHMAKMAALNEQMKAQVAMASPSADAVDGTAQVLSVGMTTGSVNNDPILPVELLVTAPGGAPRPVTATMVVPMGQLSRLSPGASLPVRVSVGQPDQVAINWAAVSS
jgi:hypothetical protein